MIRPTNKGVTIHQFNQSASKSSATKPTVQQTRVGWGQSASATLARDLREQLTSQAGRERFAELFENQLNAPDADEGFAWDPSTERSMQWTFRASAMGDDSLVARVAGRQLTLESEGSGLVGKADINGHTREELSTAIAKAVADLDAKVAAARGE